mmetsp:Transcript_4670/g.13055  ORF Transcript_4670/g.13055 Transcript_4670/m.13055 type:complete len:273 (-) Transcript_4670:2310-3128(-)
MSFPSMAQSAGRFPGCELSVISEGSQSYLTSVEGDGDSTGRNHSFADSESHSSSTLQSGSHSNGRTTPFSQQESSLLGVCTQLDQENDDIDEMIIDVDSGTVVDQGGEIGVFRDDGAHHQPFSTLHQNYLQSSSSSSQSARQHHSNNNNNSSNKCIHNNNNNPLPIQWGLPHRPEIPRAALGPRHFCREMHGSSKHLALLLPWQIWRSGLPIKSPRWLNSHPPVAARPLLLVATRRSFQEWEPRQRRNRVSMVECPDCCPVENPFYRPMPRQ